jgi:hypothetical protein
VLDAPLAPDAPPVLDAPLAPDAPPVPDAPSVPGAPSGPETEPVPAVDPTLVAATDTAPAVDPTAVAETDPVTAADPTPDAATESGAAPPVDYTLVDPTEPAVTDEAAAATATTDGPSETADRPPHRPPLAVAGTAVAAGATAVAAGATTVAAVVMRFARSVVAAVKHVMAKLGEESAWVLGSSAILAAFALGWLAAIIWSFRHAPGFSARDRILQFLQPGTPVFALAILVALALFTIDRRFEPPPARRSRMHGLLPGGLFLAGAIVMLSAVIGIVVELTNFGGGVDAAFVSLISYAAVLLVGAVDTWWAYLEFKADRKAGPLPD